MDFFRLDKSKPYKVVHGFKQGSIIAGIMSIVFGAIWASISLGVMLPLIMDDISNAPIVIPFMIVFMLVGFGIGIVGIRSCITAVVTKRKVNSILDNGLVTTGYIANVDYRRYSGGKNSSGGWEHTVNYQFNDNNGIMHSGFYKFRQSTQKIIDANSPVAVIFFNGLSLHLEEFSLLDGDIANNNAGAFAPFTHGVASLQSIGCGLTQADIENRNYAVQHYGGILNPVTYNADFNKDFDYRGKLTKFHVGMGVVVCLIALGIFIGVLFGAIIPGIESENWVAMGLSVAFPSIPIVLLMFFGIFTFRACLRSKKKFNDVKQNWRFTIGISYRQKQNEGLAQGITQYSYIDGHGRLTHGIRKGASVISPVISRNVDFNGIVQPSFNPDPILEIQPEVIAYNGKGDCMIVDRVTLI